MPSLDWLGIPAIIVAVGICRWLFKAADAREIEAQARLLEAQNAAKAAPLPDTRSENTGGRDREGA